MHRVRPHPAYVEDLARQLIAVPSVVNTPGEGALADRLHALLARLPYLRAHPDRLRRLPVPGRHARPALLAWLSGAEHTPPAGTAGDAGGDRPVGSALRDAVILLGHYDTVGIEDYGDLAELATQPDRLAAELRARASRLPDDAAADLRSPEWLWGRGAVDMKSGLAVQLAVFEALAADPSALAGDVVLLWTPDEEDGSLGVQAALPALAALADQAGLRYVAVLNADFTGPLYPGDPHRYVYLGSVGKILPAFYVRGQEVHASDPFAGADPNLLAGAIVRRIAFNADLADAAAEPTVEGAPEREWVPPPVPLKQADLKEVYDVQTPGEATVWLNALLAGSTPETATRRLREAAQFAVRDALHLLLARHHRYHRLAGYPFEPPERPALVQTLPELIAEMRQAGGDAALAAWHAELRRLRAPDLRRWCLEAVRRLARRAPDRRPRVVFYYGSGLVPRTVVDPASERGRRLVEAVTGAVRELARRAPDVPFAVRRYYPYISDLSFLCPGPDDDRLQAFAEMMPAWGVRYRLDRAPARRLGAPGANIGPYGKDAHRPTERVHRGYTFGLLPQLLEGVIRRLLAGPVGRGARAGSGNPG